MQVTKMMGQSWASHSPKLRPCSVCVCNPKQVVRGWETQTNRGWLCLVASCPRQMFGLTEGEAMSAKRTHSRFPICQPGGSCSL